MQSKKKKKRPQRTVVIRDKCTSANVERIQKKNGYSEKLSQVVAQAAALKHVRVKPSKIPFNKNRFSFFSLLF